MWLSIRYNPPLGKGLQYRLSEYHNSKAKETCFTKRGVLRQERDSNMKKFWIIWLVVIWAAVICLFVRNCRHSKEAVPAMGGQAWYDPNGSELVELVGGEAAVDAIPIDVENVAGGIVLTGTGWVVEAYTDFVITTMSGKDLNINIEGDSITITGDADLNEAAKVFFYEHLKPMVDEYIKERGKEQ